MEILGQKIQRGKTYQLKMDIAKLHTRNVVSVPVIVSRAKIDGPTLLLNAGVHGDELNGVEIVRRIIASGNHKPKVGVIICIPVLNVFAFINLQRKFPDGRDLNRVFPGTKKGSLASQFAYAFRTEIAPHIDIMLDFHTGGADRVNAPQIRCVKEDLKSVELAKVFSPPFIVYSRIIPKTMRETMSKLGTTILLFEGGKSLLFDEEIIQSGYNGALRVLNFLKMSDEVIPANPSSIVVDGSKWLRAPYSGLFHSTVANGNKVLKKDIIGFISDPYGNFNKKVVAPHDGFVFCVNSAPVVNRGDALYHITSEAKKMNHEKKLL